VKKRNTNKLDKNIVMMKSINKRLMKAKLYITKIQRKKARI
jgi:hypothetical protein